MFWAKRTETETPEDHWEKLIELEKECDFSEFSTKLLISKFITSISDRKLPDKLLKEKDLHIPKVVEQIQQNSYDRKNKKNTITENNIYRTIRDKVKKETQRPKLQIL